MHRSRTLAGLGVLVAGASLALPFATLGEDGSIGGIEADAWPVMLFLGPMLLLLLFGDRGDAPARAIAWIATGLAAAGLAFAVVKAVDAHLAAADASGTVGAGPWVLVAGAATALVGIAIGFSRRL
ncbi:MAG: hypothetical protein MUP76_11170 [Acidimicrobiia bacterium]|nr:hypothetical protein [Acidimicrobiia bacterium]